MNRQARQENIIYATLWAILFIVPAVMIYYQSVRSQVDFRWGELLMIWRRMSMFLAVFLIHNFFLAPILVYRQQRLRYFSFVAALVLIFATVQCISRPPMGDRPPMDEPVERRPPMDEFRGPMADFHRPAFGKEPLRRERHEPAVLFGQHDLIATIMLIMMLGMNIGIKLYFRQKSDQQKLIDLERENLERQLEYLKYQINPHFLMNTLNNIHALIDIEPEQAKESIVELSKIMRFVLYEGSKQKVPLNREIGFLENYIELMRMRVADHVKISFELPERMPDCEIPPLIFITFVENAFKHGVSYRQASFIDIRIDTTADTLHFACTNSRIPQSEDKHGGVGLQNVRRRLDLIYPDRYTLDIRENEETYNIDLTLPLND